MIKRKSGWADSPFFTPSDVAHQSGHDQPIFPTPQPQPTATDVVSRYHDTSLDLVKQAVKELGKEATTYRFTLLEKRSLAEVVYAYRSRSIKTTENEIIRVALNY